MGFVLERWQHWEILPGQISISSQKALGQSPRMTGHENASGCKAGFVSAKRTLIFLLFWSLYIFTDPIVRHFGHAYRSNNPGMVDCRIPKFCIIYGTVLYLSQELQKIGPSCFLGSLIFRPQYKNQEGGISLFLSDQTNDCMKNTPIPPIYEILRI